MASGAFSNKCLIYTLYVKKKNHLIGFLSDGWFIVIVLTRLLYSPLFHFLFFCLISYLLPSSASCGGWLCGLSVGWLKRKQDAWFQQQESPSGFTWIWCLFCPSVQCLADTLTICKVFTEQTTPSDSTHTNTVGAWNFHSCRETKTFLSLQPDSHSHSSTLSLLRAAHSASVWWAGSL